MIGSGRVVLPDVREWLGVTLGSLGGPPDVRELLGDSPGCPGVVGRLSRMSLRGGRPFRMSGSCREALLDVREWSGCPPGCPGVVGRPSRLFGSGWETLLNVGDAHRDIWEWSEGPPGFPGVVGGPL